MLPSAHHINHQSLVLRLDKWPLADMEAAGLRLLAAVCPVGGRGAGAEWTQRDNIIFIQLSLVAKVML
jgi:hypothetical protein